VVNAAQNAGAALAGAVNSAMAGINALINPVVIPSIRVGTVTVGPLESVDSAAGGYVLYPSKPNNNMAQAVYRK